MKGDLWHRNGFLWVNCTRKSKFCSTFSVLKLECLVMGRRKYLHKSSLYAFSLQIGLNQVFWHSESDFVFLVVFYMYMVNE